MDIAYVTLPQGRRIALETAKMNGFVCHQPLKGKIVAVRPERDHLLIQIDESERKLALSITACRRPSYEDGVLTFGELVEKPDVYPGLEAIVIMGRDSQRSYAPVPEVIGAIAEGLEETEAIRLPYMDGIEVPRRQRRRRALAV